MLSNNEQDEKVYLDWQLGTRISFLFFSLSPPPVSRRIEAPSVLRSRALTIACRREVGGFGLPSVNGIRAYCIDVYELCSGGMDERVQRRSSRPTPYPTSCTRMDIGRERDVRASPAQREIRNLSNRWQSRPSPPPPPPVYIRSTYSDRAVSVHQSADRRLHTYPGSLYTLVYNRADRCVRSGPPISSTLIQHAPGESGVALSLVDARRELRSGIIFGMKN